MYCVQKQNGLWYRGGGGRGGVSGDHVWLAVPTPPNRFECSSWGNKNGGRNLARQAADRYKYLYEMHKKFKIRAHGTDFLLSITCVTPILSNNVQMMSSPAWRKTVHRNMSLSFLVEQAPIQLPCPAILALWFVWYLTNSVLIAEKWYLRYCRHYQLTIFHEPLHAK